MTAVKHADGICRCGWCGEDPLYVAYHDEEWGVPEYDSRALFKKLLLDGFQAGLSWITILRKRDNFRLAFDGFDPEIVARRPAELEGEGDRQLVPPDPGDGLTQGRSRVGVWADLAMGQTT